MRRLVPSLALVASLAAVACGQEAGGRGTGGVTTGGKGDNTEQDSSDEGGTDQPLSDHRDATETCEAVAEHLRAHVNPARSDAVVDLERDRNDCLVRANDAARPVIDAKLEATGDTLRGQTDRTLRSHRDGAVGACNALVEAHPDAGGDALAAVATSCIAGIELHLARVLDGYVDFGVAPFSIPGARDRYPSCYDALDGALELATGSADEVAAQTALAECILAEHEVLLPELATRIVATFPGRDAATVEAELGEALLALQETRETMCSIAVHAGPSAGTADADLDVAECLVDVSIQAGDTIIWVAPDLLVEDGGGSSESEGGTSEGESSSSDDGGFDSSTSY